MKILIIAIILLFIAPRSEALGFRVLDDLKILRESGFRFEYSLADTENVFSLVIEAPHVFKFGSDGDNFTKPFQAFTVIQTAEPIEDDRHLITGDSSRFDLQSFTNEAKQFQTRCDILVANAATSYVLVTFARELEDQNDWPMLVYIPVAKIVEQLKKEQSQKMQNNKGCSEG